MSEQPQFEDFLCKKDQLPKTPNSIEEGCERLKEFIENTSKELGSPIDKTGRISMDQAGGENLKLHKKEVEEVKANWKRALMTDLERKYGATYSEEQRVKMAEKIIRLGDVWEMLSTAILRKNLGEDFIVVRTSEYDDFCNKFGKADNFILDRKTGRILCAFDEIVTLSEEKTDERLRDKKQSISRKNLSGAGVSLEYAIYPKEKEGKTALKRCKGPVREIPVFCLAISEDDLKRVLIDPSTEGKVFQEMIDSIKGQANEFKNGPLNVQFNNLLGFFEKFSRKS